jgi:3-oxoadipate enol-lactonase
MLGMNFLDTGTACLRYELRQLQPAAHCTYVLVHEMGGGLENWDDVLPALTRRGDVLRYDLRGAGLSEKLVATPTLAQMAGDLLALIASVCPEGKLLVVGAALGAAIALHAARELQGRVCGLALLCPSLGVAAERQAELEGIADRIERHGMRAVIDSHLARSYPPALRGDAARFAGFRARQMGADPRSYAASYRMLAAMRPEALLGPIPCRTLVLSGTRDGARPPALVQAVAAGLPGAQYRELDGGHFLAWQAPLEVGVELAGLAG